MDVWQAAIVFSMHGGSIPWRECPRTWRAAHGACTPGDFDLESEAYALDLVVGWNVVTQVVTDVAGDAFTIEYRTATPPGAFSWRYVPAPAPIAPP